MNKEVKFWRLGEFVIGEKKGKLKWRTHMRFDEEALEQSVDVHRLSGEAVIEENVLIMKSWSLHDEPQKTGQELVDWIVSLPKWEKTPYWVKIDDFGKGLLMSSKTLEEVPEKEAELIRDAVME